MQSGNGGLEDFSILIPDDKTIVSLAELNSELLTSVYLGDKEAVIRALHQGASVNACCCQTGFSALLLAVARGHDDVTQLLIQGHASIWWRDHKGRQAVHLAAATGNLLVLQTLAAYDPQIVSSVVDPRLAVTADSQELDYCHNNHDSFLFKVPPLQQGETALHAASSRLHLSCVLFILECDESLTHVHDARGLSALDVVGDLYEGNFYYSSRSKSQSSTTNNLLDFSSKSPNSIREERQERNSLTLNIEVSGDVNDSQDSVAVMVVKTLLSKGAKMPNVGYQGHKTTCLHLAVRILDIQLLEFLMMNYGHLLQIKNQRGETPLHMAVDLKSNEILKALLQTGFAQKGVDMRDNEKRTALHMAVSQAWQNGVDTLLGAGADPTAKDNKENNVLHLAAGNYEVMRSLIKVFGATKMINSKNGLDYTPLWRAVLVGSLECTTLLLRYGADIYTTWRDGRNLLHLASACGHQTILETLMEDVNFRRQKDSVDEYGLSPLHLATARGHRDCVEVLMKHTCDVTVCTNRKWEGLPSGCTPLHAASRHGFADIAKRFIKANSIAMTIKNKYGFTPLLVAIHFKRIDCVKALLQNGANLSDSIEHTSPWHHTASVKTTAFEFILNSFPQPESIILDALDSFIVNSEWSPGKAILRFDRLLPDSSNQFGVIQGLMRCRKHIKTEQILLHPVIEAFLFLKWKRLRGTFFALMFVHFISTVVFTVFLQPSITENPFIEAVLLIIIYVWLFFFSVQDWLMKDRPFHWSQLLTTEVVFKCATGLVVLATVAGHIAKTYWVSSVSPVAMVCVWSQLAWLLSCWTRPGVYILMFFTVIKKVVQVLATFSFLILGFTFAFMIVFNRAESFSSIWKAAAMMILMTQELEYDNYEPSSTGKMMFVMFALLVSIALMNLMTGLAVSDVTILEKQGRAQCLLKQLKFLRGLEVFVCRLVSVFYPSYDKQELLVKNNCYVVLGSKKRGRRNGLSRELEETVFNIIINRQNNKS